ncbi:MAG: glycoside hydrolase family 127 protein, partial [Clostridia bacterium]
FFYTNPLEMWEEASEKAGIFWHIKSKRPGWFGCACCPPNLARMITSLGSYIYSSDADTIYTHLFIGGQAEIDMPFGKVTVEQKSNYPWDGNILFNVSGGSYTLALRIPSWSRSFEIKVNGLKVNPELKKGYAYISRSWKDEDSVSLRLPMPIEFMEANPLAREDNGQVAIMRGPVVYCLESADNGDCLSALHIKDLNSFEAYVDNSLFEGAVYIKGKALRRKKWEANELYRPVSAAQEEEETEITAIPYAFWDNRQDTREMTVWIRR